MNFYRVEAFAITDTGKKEFVGNVVVEKHISIPALGKNEVKDSASNFSYALLEEDAKENTIGQRKDIIDQAGFDIGVYKADLNKQNIATVDQVIEYGTIFPLAKICDKQEEINFALNNNLKGYHSARR